MSKTRYATFAWTVLGITLLVILWGAVVRATGSGAGCGNHWPDCNGEVIPLDMGTQTFIEYFHRVTSGAAGLLALALWIAARKTFPRAAGEKAHGARWAAFWALVFMTGEALLGAMLVIFELVGDNASMTRAWVMGGHLLNTFMLIAMQSLTAFWATRDQDRFELGEHPKLRKAFLAATAGIALVGMSGAIVALGDTLFPTETLADGIAQDFDPNAPLLIRLRIFHPVLAVIVGLGILALSSKVRDRFPGEARRLANLLHLTVYIQLLAGGVNLVLRAPVWMQMVHLLLADLLWILMVLTAAAIPPEVADDA